MCGRLGGACGRAASKSSSKMWLPISLRVNIPLACSRRDSACRGCRLLDGRSEWPNMRRDLLELANPLISPQDKLRLVKRMRATYTLFSVAS